MIVITTPAGQIGRQVLDRVLDRGEPVRVIARDPSRLPEGVRERVEVVPGSHGDADVLDRAFDGADSVFWLVPPNPRAASVDAAYVDFTRPACEAFGRHGVNRVVGVSALGRGVSDNAGFVSATLAADDAIAATGVAYRALVMPSFMDNVLRQVVPIRDRGVYSQPIPGDLKAPTCATRDIAAVAARLLLDHSWSGNGSVAVLGPEDLSADDMARTMSEVLGRPVRFERTPIEAYRAMLTGNGMSDAMAQGMVDMVVAKENGLDNAEPRTPGSSTPTSFRKWCEEVLRPAVLA
ncbi:NAD(P)H-binding protein [Umezawaea sp. Da 62-37]|uniref:NmrA family NAD(P)-binding protein n=1 Tax=Umezawaea sp. Da 62-37 TaxID=3075927 RepID=UPI0028F72B06|nr:NAD(P)H-binding protein [Umezawaea sp. Da 62-37]WNV87184.1 NAD(P)H-binding protein [Umezawaea sp. Da 62-37]